ncbi:MAG: hypothetical protein KJ077_50345 [Anaerolineae bacterium]|nr:hypothetical protein [Anaerolineae bacterium]
MSDKKSLETEIIEWLEKQGYPLEMQVASSFKEAGFVVSQSRLYKDPQTSIEREIDIEAVK